MSVHKRGERWIAKVWSGGKWQWVGTFSTRREARQAELAAKPLPSWTVTVEQFCARWLEDYARPAASSRRNYHYALQSFRREYGSRRLGSFTRPEAQRWATKVPYTTYRTVRTMYADALRDGVVNLNPFAGLRIPQPQGRRHLEVLTEEQVIKLADTALEVHDDHLGPMARTLILTAGFVGLRAGELGGLEWGDVDLRRNRLHVMRALSADGLKEPKSGEPRLCVLPPPASEALSGLERFAGEPAVFLTPRGKRFGKGAIHRYFVPVRAAFGQPKLQFHALRHAAATLMLERGLTPEDVAIQLGHRDGGRLVAVLYGHPNEDRARERIEMAFAEVPARLEAGRR